MVKVKKKISSKRLQKKKSQHGSAKDKTSKDGVPVKMDDALPLSQDSSDEMDENFVNSAVKEDEDYFSETNFDKSLIGVGKLSRKQYLKKLKESDRDFYEAMMAASDDLALTSEGDKEEGEDSEQMNEEGKKMPVKKKKEMKKKRREALDEIEDDIESSAISFSGNMITQAMITEWEKELYTSNAVNAFVEVSDALLAALESIQGGDEAETTSRYAVKNHQIFNGIVNLCLQHVPPALYKMLQLKTYSENPATSKKWRKLRIFIKKYLLHLTTLIESILEPTAMEVIVKKGVVPLVGCYAAVPVRARQLLKKLISIWATNEEQKIRVLVFIVIFRVVHAFPAQLDLTLKNMYLHYVKNCRFTSPSTWGYINFMRYSLVELYSLDQTLAYRHAFIFIRQMAFHLRSAMLMKTKARIQLVYNWQYIHCIYLWVELLSKTHPSPVLGPLIYPVVQIAIGTMKLNPTSAYFPLVFHVCRILTDLAEATGTFIPVMPFLLEVLQSRRLKKKHSRLSLKPHPWMCVLRLTKSALQSSGFRGSLVNQVHDGLVKYLSVMSSSITFPELVVPAVVQLKAFMKSCKVVEFSQRIKQLVARINENSTFILERRKTITFPIADEESVRNWEIATRQAGPPLALYYASWKKKYGKESLHEVHGSVDVENYTLNLMRKEREKRDGAAASDSEEDSSDDDVGDSHGDTDEEDDRPPKRKKIKTTVKEEKRKEEKMSALKKMGGRKMTKKKPQNVIEATGEEDVVVPLNLSDIEPDDEFDENNDSGDASNED